MSRARATEPFIHAAWLFVQSLAMIGTTGPGAADAVTLANTRGSFGLYPAQDFRVTTGRCTDCPTSPSALWYFENETIAVPMAGRPVAGFATGTRTFDDVRAWQAARPRDAPIDYPPLVWIEAAGSVHGARLAENGKAVTVAGETLAFAPVEKIPLNRSYFDASSVAFLAQRDISVRGEIDGDGRLVARTIWPEDFRFAEVPQARVLSPGLSAAQALRTMMREAPEGGARSPYAAVTLWQRPGAAPADWRGRTVLAFMVNGAQGDDDEAHGGHFAIVTGRVADDGAIGDWLVNNFYTLDAESEKGIIAAPVPLDNYLADLNSGQAWYRPSYMLVAVLSNERAATLVQSALGRVYNQFYRHQLVYYHPTQNCTSISVDTLRALGWDVPVRGPSSRLLAWAGFPFIAAKEMSIAKAKLAFDYLHTDQTRLMPAAALEEIFGSLLALGANSNANGYAGGPLAQMLARDVDALAFVRMPQIPSSRVFGDAPAVTTWEYRTRVPSDPSHAQIVPVPPRPFPERLRDPDLLPQPERASDVAAMVWGAILLVGIPLLIYRLLRQKALR